MKTYRITISFDDPYPKESVYREEASSFATAVKRGLEKFRKEHKGKRIKDLSLMCQDLGTAVKKEEYKLSPRFQKSLDKALDVVNDFARQEGII